MNCKRGGLAFSVQISAVSGERSANPSDDRRYWFRLDRYRCI